MAGALPVAGIKHPAGVSQPNATRALISQLQLLTPQYYEKYVQKYGNEDFTMWLATYAGMELVKNRDFFWFESRGKLMPAVTVKTAVNGPSAGATVTVAIATEDHYDSGASSALRVGETLRIASSNIEGKILTVDKTTPNAHTCTVRPLQSTQSFTSQGSANLLANEVLIFAGHTEAGEGSDSIEPIIDLDEKFTNTTTEIRESWSATDRAEMTEVFYKGIPAEGQLQGVEQAGTSLYTLKGMRKANMRFKNNIEFKLMRGDIQNNTGLTNSVGTQGAIPQIIARGQAVTYNIGSLDLSKVHEITRIMDVQGSAKEYLWLMDANQRQDFSDSMFTQFPAGAWVWGESEKSQEAAIVFGVQSVKMDGYLMKAKKYLPFNTEVVTGKAPANDYFRDFGILMPQSETADARNSARVYKSIQVIYENPPAGGTIGNGIRVWQHGGGSRKATNGKMEDKVEMITYRAIRVTAANQFITVEGL